jgi:hypothetical protein
MKLSLALIVVAAAVLATPVLAGPTPKRPVCQVLKVPSRDAKRPEPCRKQPIPPVIDPTPLFLASTAGSRSNLSDLS